MGVGVVVKGRDEEEVCWKSISAAILFGNTRSVTFVLSFVRSFGQEAEATKTQRRPKEAETTNLPHSPHLSPNSSKSSPTNSSN